MKRKLHLLYYSAIVAILLCAGNMQAQINYTANFDTGANSWALDEFETTSVAACTGGGALRVNLYDGFFNGYEGQATSPSIGTSVGTPLTISYKYKVVNYSSGTPTVGTPASEEFGILQLYYATSLTATPTLVETIDSSNQVTSASCTTRTVTITVPAGSPVYLAFYAALDNFDSDVFVYIDEVTATQPAATACSGTPAASAAVAAAASVCTNQNASLSLNPMYTNTGLTYQWQTSADGVTYTNAGAGSTSAAYNAPVTAVTWYRALITCTASGQTTTSAPVQVTSTGTLCYCEPEFSEATEPITLVNFAGINNTSPATVTGAPAYQDFTALTPAQVTQGQTYPITLKGNTDGNFQNAFKVYIDFNKDGDFNDPGESFNAGLIVNSTGSDATQAITQITIPATAMTGLTRMRIVKIYTEDDVYPTGPCEDYFYGQAEDYTINISAATVGCATAPATSTITAQNTTVCAGANITLSLSGTYTNGETFQWQSSADGAAFTNIAGATAATYLTNQTTSTYYRAIITCAEGNLSVTTAAVQIQTQVTNAPAAGTAATFCNSATVANLTGAATGTGIQWYAAATGGTALTAGTVLTNGTIYYASQTVNGCESAQRLAIAVTINTTPVPVPGIVPPVFCNNATAADMIGQLGGNNILLYAAQTGGTALTANTALTNGTTYYASQTVNGCESERIAITATITVVPVPVIPTPQMLDGNNNTLADIETNGIENGQIIFYATAEDALSGTNPLPLTTLITTDPTVYYAVQTFNDCNSDVVSFTASMPFVNTKYFDAATFKFYPNPVNDILTISYSQAIDSVEVYNLIGQQVMVKTVNANQAAINVSGLAAGTYMVKVTAAGSIKTIKIIKH